MKQPRFKMFAREAKEAGEVKEAWFKMRPWLKMFTVIFAIVAFTYAILAFVVVFTNDSGGGGNDTAVSGGGATSPSDVVDSAYCPSEGDGNELIASVGDLEYRCADFLDDAPFAFGQKDLAALSADQVALWLSRWVQISAMQQEAAKNGVEITSGHKEESLNTIVQSVEGFDSNAPGADTMIEQEAFFVALREWAESEIPDMTDEDIDEVDFLCSRHILVSTEAEAQDVVQRLSDGEDFTALAEELSLDTASAVNGGDLGCQAQGLFVQEFDAAYDAEAGDVITVSSQFGNHVVEVFSTGTLTAESHPQLDVDALDAARQAGIDSLEQVAAGRRNTLINTKIVGEALTTYKSEVFINSSYGVWNSEDFTVAAPFTAPEVSPTTTLTTAPEVSPTTTPAS